MKQKLQALPLPKETEKDTRHPLRTHLLYKRGTHRPLSQNLIPNSCRAKHKRQQGSQGYSARCISVQHSTAQQHTHRKKIREQHKKISIPTKNKRQQHLCMIYTLRFDQFEVEGRTRLSICTCRAWRGYRCSGVGEKRREEARKRWVGCGAIGTG